jgi:DNA-binding beta-propeller fold protein YncE
VRRSNLVLVVVVGLVGCAKAPPAVPPRSTPAPLASGSAVSPVTSPNMEGEPGDLTMKPLALPGAKGPVTLDYLAYEPSRTGHARVWVPVGDTASVDVLDVTDGSFKRIDGFKAIEREVRGKKRMLGPSSVAVGDGFVYVGNRGTNELCAVDASTLALGRCLKLMSPPDGVAYVASTKEVWVTTPRDESITVLDAAQPDAPKAKTTIKLGGAPEGYAVDESRGLFFTNLEDKNRTLAIDVRTYKPREPWKLGCGPDGPRGVAADRARGFVFVACTDHVEVLDGAGIGAVIGRLETGDGVDNIDWLETRRLLYVAAARAARLTVARVDDAGNPTVVAKGASSAGARNAVADGSGNAYVADPAGGRLLVFAGTGL